MKYIFSDVNSVELQQTGPDTKETQQATGQDTKETEQATEPILGSVENEVTP